MREAPKIDELFFEEARVYEEKKQEQLKLQYEEDLKKQEQLKLQYEEDLKLAQYLQDNQTSSSSDSDSDEESDEDSQSEADLQRPELKSNQPVGYKIFTKEDFAVLIRTTFDEYYKADFNRASVDVEYYCEIVEKMPEWGSYQVFLAENTANILNNKTVPWLDIGDLPTNYAFNRSAAFQKFNTPDQNPPYQFYFNYSEWLDGYLCNLEKLFDSLDAMNRKVNRQMLIETIDKATQVVMATKGILAKKNRI